MTVSVTAIASVAAITTLEIAVFARQYDLTGQVNASLTVDFHAFNDNFIAYVDNVFYLFHPFRRKLGNVNQAFFTGQNFYKGTEGHKARNLADIRFADFYVLRQIFNPCLGLSAAFSVYGSDVYETRIVNVDFGTRFFRENAVL